MAREHYEDYKREMQKIQDESRLRDLLYVLLKKMDFGNVEITHGPNEQGKDLVFSSLNPLEGTDWYAVVVKKGSITGRADISTASVKTVRNQVELCFEQPYFFAKENTRVYMNKVIVAASGAISDAAERQIIEKLAERANVSFWPVNILVNLVEKHIPNYFADIDLFVSEYYNNLNQDFERLSELKSFRYKKELKKLVEIFIEPTLVITKTQLGEQKEILQKPLKFEFRKAHTLLGSSDNVLIVGEPGCGKSTLFRELILNMIKNCQAKKEYRVLPVMARFVDVVRKGSIQEAIKSAIEQHNPRGYEFDIGAKVARGEICLFLDGLDEIPIDAEIQRALDITSEFSKVHKNVRIIASSRNIDFVKQREQVGHFTKMEILQLNYRQAQNFISKWFSEDESKKKRLLESLKNTEILNKLPKTPLVLTLIAILFDENEQEIPSNLTELYSMFTELFLGRWDVERNIETRFEYELKDRILRLLALKLHEGGHEEISSPELKELVDEYFEERGIQKNVDEFLFEIESRSQLIFRNPRSSYQFKHLSFQEFFASKELFESHAAREFIVERFLDLWWQEVIFFYCGRMKECPTVVRDIIRKVPFDTIAAQFRKVTGLGHVLQAAYATKTSDKVEAIKHALDLLVR